MCGIRIKIDCEEYVCDFRFERRLSIIRGDSGVGKTTLAYLIDQRLAEINLDSTFDVVLLPRNRWQGFIQINTDCIILIDDFHIVGTAEFADIYSKYAVRNNLYFIIMSRENVSLKSTGRLSYSTNSIFRMVSDGIYHRLEPYFSFGTFDKDTFDVCITEDTTSGYIFFKRLFEGVLEVIPSSNGKSSIIDDVKQLTRSYNNILVIVDTASYGCHIEKFCSVFGLSKSNICFINDYECFEELLMRSNLISKIGDIGVQLNELPVYANNYLSWERYFENAVKVATENKLYRYNHNSGRLRKCYTCSCDDCNTKKRSSCDCNSTGDKFSYLLGNTKYDYLLEFHNKQ